MNLRSKTTKKKIAHYVLLLSLYPNQTQLHKFDYKLFKICIFINIGFASKLNNEVPYSVYKK